MKFVVAPQALKGSLDAPAVGAAIATGLRRVLPAADLAVLPIADGGEGTLDALVAATGGQLRQARVTGPLGEPVEARFGLLGSRETDDGATAIIEMAAASGLPLVPEARRDPRVTTTYGTGELMLAALDAGARHLLIGIGGSATNDGGAGMAQALGVRLLDTAGNELPRGGAALAHLARIDPTWLDARLRGVDVTVLSDVDNPLCGPRGASAIYGPQKGATPAMVAELDAALAHYAAVLRRDLGADVADLPGAGAAGGLGAGLMALLGARLRPGAEAVLGAIGLAGHLAGAALVFTAEGRVDEQTAMGKSVGAVARLARERAIPVIVLAGSLGSGYAALYSSGVHAVVPLADGPRTLAESMAHAAELTADAAERALRLVLVGAALPRPQT
jgi:glycerate 2-kinase